MLGSTPKTAATAEPKPSQTTEPESSLSLGSRLRPPSVTPEVSPTVSTAVTMNMMHIGMIASMRNTGLTGMSLGSANQAAEPTLDHCVT